MNNLIHVVLNLKKSMLLTITITSQEDAIHHPGLQLEDQSILMMAQDRHSDQILPDEIAVI